MPRHIHLGVYDPHVEPYQHKPQAEFLDHVDAFKAKNDAHVADILAKGGNPHRDHRPLQYIHFVGGRGSAKTTAAAMALFKVAMECPGFHTAWTARTNGEIDTVLLIELEKVVPPHYNVWSVKSSRSARWIEWAGGHKTHLVSRNVDNPRKRPALGLNIMGVFHDEAATSFDQSKFDDIENAVREPDSPYLFSVSMSTPLPNGYYGYCYASDSPIIFSSSFDNPHLSREQLNKRLSMMDELTAQQEIYGKFVQTTGRQWPTFVEKPWPEGNILDGYKFRQDKPWILAADLGAGSSGWQIYQYVDVPGVPWKLAVCCAELTASRMGIETVTAEIIEHYCGGDRRNGPSKVIVGSDVVNPGNTGIAAAWHFEQLGWEYQSPTGKLASKELQRQVARGLILNTAGERRFAVAGNLNKHGTYEIAKQHFGERKVRGILNMFRNDTFPEGGSKDVFVKDKATRGINCLEDDRDPFLYWGTMCHTPEWTTYDRWAA